METKDIKDIKFTTKSIMLTDKQMQTIEDLLDTLCDMGCDDFDDIDYRNLSKQDASELISEMLDKIDELDFYDDLLWDCGDPLYDCGDR